MDNFFYNLGAIPIDISSIVLFLAFFNLRDPRKCALLLGCFFVVERLACALTRLPLEWTSLLVLLAIVMRFGRGSPSARLLRFLGSLTLINLLAYLQVLPWIIAHGATPDYFRDEILQHPDFFVMEFAGALLNIVFGYLVSIVIRRYDRERVFELDFPGALYVALQAVCMFVLLASSFVIQEPDVTSMAVITCAQFFSVAASLLFLRDAIAATEANTAEMHARAMSTSAAGYLRHFREVEDSIAAMAMVRHDLRNQLQVAGALAQSGHAEDAAAMLSDLDGQLEQHGIEKIASFEALDGHESRGADAQMASGVMRTVRSNLWSVAYVADFVLLVILLMRLYSLPEIPRAALAVGIGLFVLWASLTPFLVRKVRMAQQVEFARVRAQMARDQLEARVYYGRRLANEAERAHALENKMRESVKLAWAQLGGGAEGAPAQAGKEPEQADNCTPALPPYVPYCENRMLDALLALKASLCSDAGIAFRCMADIPENIGIESLDLCALFSNALDNAVAACEAVPEGKRWIDVAARVQAGYLVMAVRNSCPPGASPSSGEAPTLEGHGWGLRILEGLVREYDGMLKTGEQDGVFTLRVMLRASGD